MTQRAIHSQWRIPTARCERSQPTSYQRALRQARRTAALRCPFDWEGYEPLPPGESLEARDSVEAEVWAMIEYEAREKQRERAGLPPEPLLTRDIKSIRVLWVEARREFQSKPCRQRDRTT